MGIRAKQHPCCHNAYSISRVLLYIRFYGFIWWFISKVTSLSPAEDGASGGTHGQGDTMPVAPSTPVFYYE